VLPPHLVALVRVLHHTEDHVLRELHDETHRRRRSPLAGELGICCRCARLCACVGGLVRCLPAFAWGDVAIEAHLVWAWRWAGLV
jgi:hypothetical protein